MTNPFEIPARPVDCLSDYGLDVLAGAPATAVAGAARAHVEGCESCRVRLEAVLSQKMDFANRDLPAFPEASPVRTSRGARRTVVWKSAFAGATGILALAASVFLLAREPKAPLTDEHDVKGVKGIGASFGFDIVRGDGAIVGDELTAVAHPGDRLKWRFALREPSYVAVLSRDGAGTATVYFPDGPTAQRLSPDNGSTTAVELDEVLGAEALYALFCDRPIELSPLRDELARTGRVTAPEGCTVRTGGFDKRLP